MPAVPFDKPKDAAVDRVAPHRPLRNLTGPKPSPAPAPPVHKPRWNIEVYRDYYESQVLLAAAFLEDRQDEKAKAVFQSLVSRLAEGVRQFESSRPLARVLQGWKDDAENRLALIGVQPDCANRAAPPPSRRPEALPYDPVPMFRHVYEGVVKTSQDAVHSRQWAAADTALHDGMCFFQRAWDEARGDKARRGILLCWHRDLQIRRLLVASRNDRTDRASLLTFAQSINETLLPPYESAHVTETPAMS